MMLKNNNIRRFAAALAVSATLLVSCAGLETEQAGATGCLAAPSLEIDVTVDDMLLTKALDFEVDQPVMSEIRFVISNENGTVKEITGLWSEPVVLPVGTYTIDAAWGENTFGSAYFEGSASVEIGALDKETPVLTMVMANSLVRVVVSDDLADHFTPANTVSFNDGAYVGTYGEWIYVPSGADVSLALAGTNSLDNPVSFSHILESPSPKVAYDVICGKTATDWPSISLEINSADVWASRIYITSGASFEGKISEENKASVIYEAIPSSSSDWTSPATAVSENGVLVIKDLTPETEYQVRARVGALVSPVVKVTPEVDGLTATAVHTLSGGELDGTDVTSTFTKSSVVSDAIDSWNISICNSDGTPLRDVLSSLGTSDGSAITATDGWPYLPVGNGQEYIVKAYATMDGQEYMFDDLTLAVPSTPDFSLTLSAYTSYDKYACTNGVTVKDLDSATGANNCDPSTLYNAGARWSISENLMKNLNYSKTIAIYIDDDATGRTSTVSTWDYNYFYQNVSGLSWEPHTHQVKFTFDNKTVSSIKNTHHITGLPYSVAPPKNSGDHPWTEDQRGWGVVYFNWNDTEFVTWNTSGSGNTNIIGSPEFNIPDNIPIDIAMMAHGHYSKVVIDYKYHIKTNIHSGGQTVSLTVDGSDLNYDSYTINSLSLTSSAPKIQIENTHVRGDNNRLYIKSVSVRYR